jgi:hypothetical protein
MQQPAGINYFNVDVVAHLQNLSIQSTNAYFTGDNEFVIAFNEV